MVSEKVVKDPTICTLLNIREEILNEINNIQMEYSAIGNLLHDNYKYKEQIAQQDKQIKHLNKQLDKYEEER